MITAGDTYLISTPPDYQTEHLFIIIITIDDDEALIVNITTKKENSDMSCIITTGDHDFITHDSVINYKDAIKTKIKLLKTNIENNNITPHSPVSEDLLQRILKGASNSEFLPKEFKEYIP